MNTPYRRAFQLAAAILVALGAAGACADEPDTASRASAQRIAVSVCGTCHGPTGNSRNPKYPRLAGLSAEGL
jgi:cytochrome c553